MIGCAASTSDDFLCIMAKIRASSLHGQVLGLLTKWCTGLMVCLLHLYETLPHLLCLNASLEPP